MAAPPTTPRATSHYQRARYETRFERVIPRRRLGKEETMNIVITVLAVIGVIAAVFWLMRRA